MLVLPPDLPDPAQPHAVVFATVTVHDALVADLVDLEFDLGFRCRAQLTPPLRRGGQQLSGRWLATLYMRTDRTGRLLERPLVAALHAAVVAPVFRWSATGKVIALDQGTGRVRLRVMPGRPVRPFPITAHASLAQLAQVRLQTLTSLTGTVQDGELVVDVVQTDPQRTAPRAGVG